MEIFDLQNHPFELFEVKPEEGTFRGVASVFHSRVEAWMPTVILPGAFKKTLIEQKDRIRLLWQHDAHEPIGIPKSLSESQRGLEIVGRVSKTQRGQEALVLMRDGVLSLSIGFDPIKWETVKDENNIDVRQIKELRLWEISAVTFAADPQAKILEAASRYNQERARQDEAMLRQHQQNLAKLAEAIRIVKSWGV